MSLPITLGLETHEFLTKRYYIIDGFNTCLSSLDIRKVDFAKYLKFLSMLSSLQVFLFLTIFLSFVCVGPLTLYHSSSGQEFHRARSFFLSPGKCSQVSKHLQCFSTSLPCFFFFHQLGEEAINIKNILIS